MPPPWLLGMAYVARVQVLEEEKEINAGGGDSGMGKTSSPTVINEKFIITAFIISIKFIRIVIITAFIVSIKFIRIIIITAFIIKVLWQYRDKSSEFGFLQTKEFEDYLSNVIMHKFSIDRLHAGIGERGYTEE